MMASAGEDALYLVEDFQQILNSLPTELCGFGLLHRSIGLHHAPGAYRFPHHSMYVDAG